LKILIVGSLPENIAPPILEFVISNAITRYKLSFVLLRNDKRLFTSQVDKAARECNLGSWRLDNYKGVPTAIIIDDGSHKMHETYKFVEHNDMEKIVYRVYVGVPPAALPDGSRACDNCFQVGLIAPCPIGYFCKNCKACYVSQGT
jgi:hypothetical protein